MSLPGYKKKGRPALWLSVRGAKPVRCVKKVVKMPKPRTRIRPVSARAAKARRAYLAKRGVWIQGRRCCNCVGTAATEVHHTRGRLGGLLMDDAYWLPVCSGCHNWIHNNQDQARERGLLCAKGDWNRQP